MIAYSDALLRSLDEWLKYEADPEIKQQNATRLIQVIQTAVESDYRQCSEVCYRMIELSRNPAKHPNPYIKDPHVALFCDGSLPEGVSSWTTDFRVAQKIWGGVYEGFNGIIFERVPAESEVILNLGRLYRSSRFQYTLNLNPQKYQAVEQFMAQESEVILRVSKVTPDDVFSYGVQPLQAFAPTESPEAALLCDLLQILDQLGAPRPGTWRPKEESQRIYRRVIEKARDRGICVENQVTAPKSSC